MASADEETGLKSGEKSEDQDLDPDRDPELKKNGGRFDSKKAILQVTWRFPVDFKDPLNIIALIYGYLPFVIPLVFFIDMVVERRFIAFYGLAVSGVVTLINEVILKELLKQPRPYGSANRKFNEKTKKWEMKPGMPSGHVLNATTTMVWCLLEVSLRGPGFDDHPFMTGKLLLLILVCMAPVPWARVYNQDHSLAQCTVAGVLGVFAGLMAYWVRYHYFPLQAEKEWCVSKWCLGYDDDEYEDDEDYSYYSEDDSRVMTAQRVNFPTGRFKSRFTAVFEVIENDKDEETSQHRPGTPNVVIEQKPEKKVKVVVQEEAVDTSKPTDDEKTRVFPVDFERRTFHRDKVVFTKDAWGRSVVKVMNPTQRKPDL